MRNRRRNSGCSSCGGGGTTRARSIRAQQTGCGTITVRPDDTGGGGTGGGGGSGGSGGSGGGGDEDGLSREALIGGAAVAGLGIAYVASRN